MCGVSKLDYATIELHVLDRCATLCHLDDIVLDGVDCNDYSGSAMSDPLTKTLRRAYYR